MLDLRRVRRSLWIGVLLCVTLPASASGAVTIGSNLAATPSVGSSCAPGPCTGAHQVLPPTSTASDGLVAPSDGVVVRWRIKVGEVVGPVALRITRPGDSDTRTGAGMGAAVTPTADQTSVSKARLPIEAGDALGIDYVSTTAFAATAGAVSLVWSPPLLDGEPPRNTAAADLELLVNADIEADADNDGFGDESQDQCPTDASTQAPCDRSLRLFVGRHPLIRKRVTVRATGFAGSPQNLWIYADSRGRACPAERPAQGPRVRKVVSGAVEGDFRVRQLVKMKSRGRHSFCGYLGVAGGSSYATAFKTRLVRRQRLEASRARRTVARALERHKFARRVVKNLDRRCRRRNRATFSCRFSSAFPGYRLTGRGSVRLNKKLSYRFRVRVNGQEIALTDGNEGRFPG